ncbi:unnamed protein product, partial [Ectocarpus sp. 12 AP-2014]
GEDGKNGEVDLGFLHRSLAEPEDAGAYLELLLPSYKALPEDCIQKARAAFAMGLLATKKDDSELAEALHLEAVLVLDRLPEEDSGTSPLITPFGVHCLEKLGDALLKNAKYEYGILALERATECFWECSGRTARYDRLVRRVTRVTREHGDTKRALMYHSRMLEASKKIGNLNEFVYLAKEISRMLKEEGWYLEAESYLATASRLLSGLRLDKVVLRHRSGITTSGTGPNQQDNEGNGWRKTSGQEGGGPLDGNDPGPTMVPVLEHVDAGRSGHGYGSGAAGNPGGAFGGAFGVGGGGGGTRGAPGVAGVPVSMPSDGPAGGGGGGG